MVSLYLNTYVIRKEGKISSHFFLKRFYIFAWINQGCREMIKIYD